MTTSPYLYKVMPLIHTKVGTKKQHQIMCQPLLNDDGIDNVQMNKSALEKFRLY